MPTIASTSWLQGIGPQAPVVVAGGTVREVIAGLAGEYPRFASYILDDQNRVRQHVAVFINGEMQPRQQVLDMPVNPQDDVFVMQALSGG